MNFSDIYWIVGFIVFAFLLYKLCYEKRLEMERRISMGREQVRRILAKNGRRLSQYGLRIERQFSESGYSQATRGIMTDLRREPPCENDVERKSNKHSMCPFSDIMSIPENKEKSAFDDGDVSSKPKRETSRIGTAFKYLQSEANKKRYNTPFLPRNLQKPPRPDTRRASVMPVFKTPKSLPRRKSVLPILAEEVLTPRRPSVYKPAPPIQSLAAAKKEVVIVKPPVYVCPRRSSVLFNSSLFAHAPFRRLSKVCQDKDALDYQISVDISGKGANSGSAGGKSGQDISTNCVWQSDISRMRRRSRSGNLYRATRNSIISRLKMRSSVIEDIDDLNQSEYSKKGDPNPERRQSIPKLKGNYLTGNLSEFKSVFGPKAHEELWKKYNHFGPVYQINALGQKIVFLFDHMDIDALKKAEGKCPKHMDFKHLRIYRQRNNLPLGVLLSCGDDWKRQRKILSKAMNSSVVQAEYVPVINQVAKELMSLIENRLESCPRSETFQPEQDINNYAIEAFGRILYGRDLKCLSTDTETDLHKFVNIAKSNFEDAKALMTLPSCLMLLHPAWRRHNEKWNFMLETTIRQTLLSIYCDKRSPCVLSHLVQSGDMTESEMLINLTDLLHASIDTTSTAISWCLYELSQHPDCVTNIVDEYRRYVGEDIELTWSHLQKMVYLKAVIKETLRLHPVGFLVSRTLSKPMSVRNFKIPAQANVMTSMYVMGRKKDLFQDSDSFQPDRWLRDDPELARFYNDVPFGFGPRMCIGRRIAEIEIALFLLYFCLHFEFRLSATCQIDHVVKLLLAQSRPLELDLKPRKK